MFLMSHSCYWVTCGFLQCLLISMKRKYRKLLHCNGYLFNYVETATIFCAIKKILPAKYLFDFPKGPFALTFPKDKPDNTKNF